VIDWVTKIDADVLSASFSLYSLERLKEFEHFFQQPDNDENGSDHKCDVYQRAEIPDKEPQYPQD
jgi:hypothetical protein